MPLVIALLVWIFIGPLIRWFSPTAGTDDAGLFQALVFGLVLYFAACGFSWIALRLVFPKISEYVDNHMADIFELQNDSKFKFWFTLAVFAVYFFGAIIIMASVV
jgi:hypothetical protein